MIVYRLHRQRCRISADDFSPYRNSTDVRENRQPKRSLMGSSRFCLQPRYRSVVHHGHMTKPELNLLQFAAIHLAELGARSAKIVWFEMVQLNPPSDPSRHVPNDVL